MKNAKFVVVLALLALVLIIAGCQEPEYIPSQTQKAIPKDTKLVCIFFDDGWKNQYSAALPILLTHRFKATFGIITGSIDTGSGIWRYASKEEIEQLAKYGMDIASHTKTHPHLTGNLTDEQLRQEIIDSKKYLADMGLNVRTFIYPFYEWNHNVLSYVKEAGYICARGDNERRQAFNLITADAEARYHIPSFQITRQNIEEFKQIVSHTKERYHVVCLTYHFISDEGPAETSTPLANFIEQMRYLKEAGFTVVTLPDLF